jgi:hypothetical protein
VISGTTTAASFPIHHARGQQPRDDHGAAEGQDGQERARGHAHNAERRHAHHMKRETSAVTIAALTTTSIAASMLRL